MESRAEISDALAESLNQWSETLHSRSKRVSMFSNSAGWRQFYTVFHPIDVIQSIFYFSEEYETYIADYAFQQDSYITEAFPSQAEAFACIDFFLRDTKRHQHQAIWLEGSWQVLSRACTDSNEPGQALQCDRYARVGGRSQCVNDYNCREDDEISLIMRSVKPLIRPDQLQVEIDSSEQTRAPSVDGQLYFILGGEPLQYVEIQFHLRHFFRCHDEVRRADARISFYQTSELSDYRHACAELLNEPVHHYLLSAISAVQHKLQQALSSELNDAASFPNDADHVQALLDIMWQSVQTEYADF